LNLLILLPFFYFLSIIYTQENFPPSDPP
jgi:hypothetical protein